MTNLMTHFQCVTKFLNVGEKENVIYFFLSIKLNILSFDFLTRPVLSFLFLDLLFIWIYQQLSWKFQYWVGPKYFISYLNKKVQVYQCSWLWSLRAHSITRSHLFSKSICKICMPLNIYWTTFMVWPHCGGGVIVLQIYKNWN